MLTTILIVTLFVLIVINILLKLSKLKNQYEKLSTVPGPDVKNFLIGNLDQFYVPGKPLSHTIGDGLMKLSNEYSNFGIFKFHIGPKPNVCTFNADYFQEILSNSKFVKKSNEYHFVSHWLGDGLATLSPSKWRQRRKVLLPSFYSSVLNQFTPIFNSNSIKLCQNLLEEPKKDDLTETSINVTLDIICQTVLGMSNNSTISYSQYASSLQRVTNLLVHQMFTPYLWNHSIFGLTKYGREMKKHTSIMKTFIDSVVDERKRQLTSEMELVENCLNNNLTMDKVERSQLLLLDCLLKAHFDGQLTLDEVKNEINTFTFAGHDTVGISMAFTLFVLGHHMDIQAKVQEELDQVFDNEDDLLEVNSEHLNQLKYLDAVIKEVNRLYPPGPTFARQLTSDVKLGSYTIPKDTDVWFNVKALHLDENIYPEAKKFNPERFISESIKTLHPYGYAAFSLGPRNCVGQKFALIELKILLAHVLKKFTVTSLVPLDELVLTFEIILRCKTPLKAVFKPRK